ncbi:MAG: glycosyltransferase [Microthrixaceae bacterium]
MRTLLAASGGGHLTQLVNLHDRLPFDPGDVTWFTMDTPQSRSMLDGQSVVFAHPAPPRDWRAVLANGRLAATAFRRLGFEAAVSTGSSVALSVLPVARAHGAVPYYLESAARVQGPSLTGRLLSTVPGIHTACQYRTWAVGRWAYAGSVFDCFEPGPRNPAPTIASAVVTLGSQEGYPFDRLVAALHEVLPGSAEVLWQTGATSTARFGIDGLAAVTAAVLESAMASADVVVAHAGVGSALSALLAGRHPVLVARRSALGEHVDDHQAQIAGELAERGLATQCRPEDLDLEILLDAASRTVVRSEDPPPLNL